MPRGADFVTARADFVTVCADFVTACAAHDATGADFVTACADFVTACAAHDATGAAPNAIRTAPAGRGAGKIVMFLRENGGSGASVAA